MTGERERERERERVIEQHVCVNQNVCVSEFISMIGHIRIHKHNNIICNPLLVYPKVGHTYKGRSKVQLVPGPMSTGHPRVECWRHNP